MKTNIFVLVVLVCGILLNSVRLFLPYTGKIEHGLLLDYDVDSDENIYIGTMNRIRVYKDGELLRQITPPTSRKYRFYIENDQLIIGCVSDGKGGVFDLEGRELSYGELSYYDIEDTAKHKSVTVNGHSYKLSNNHGITPYKITRDGEEVYRMSSIDYLFNGIPYWIAWACCFLALVFLVFLKVSDLQTAKENGSDIWKAIFW